jgi:antitoxin (DNA-binding transcriptional repressor) of toxin-antitoxin stability system
MSSNESVTATYAARHLRELLDRVMRGETITIERYGQAIAVLALPARTEWRPNSTVLAERLNSFEPDPAGAATVERIHEEWNADWRLAEHWSQHDGAAAEPVAREPHV